jgi:hypothetical protein
MTNDKEKLDHKLDQTQPRPIAPPADPAQVHPKQKEALDIFAKFQRNRNFGISVDIAGIANQLKTEAPRAYFPEQLFVQHFLPLFADEVKPTSEVNIQTWIVKVAGSESTPVDIVDPEGKVLFTVPPVFDHSVLEQSKPGGMSMTRVERQYSRLKEVDAHASQQFLSKTLQSMHIKDKPTEEVYANMRIWNDIFKRYGKEEKIINLLNLENDPNKDKDLGIAGTSSTASDVSDYELDTD